MAIDLASNLESVLSLVVASATTAKIFLTKIQRINIKNGSKVPEYKVNDAFLILVLNLSGLQNEI